MVNNLKNELTPKISVVMSVYNGEPYLHDAIKSILSQTYANFEFIIVNDGSIDNSADIITSFNDKRINVINNKINKGLVESLNIGIKYARGEFIARMDADDISHLLRFEKQVAFLDDNMDVCLCGTSAEIIDDKKTKFIYPLEHSAIKIFMLSENAIIHPSAMWRRDIFEQFKFLYNNDFPSAEDYELWTQVILKVKVANLPEALLFYRKHSQQVTQNMQKQVEKTTQKIKIKFLNCLALQPNERETIIHLLLFNNQFKDQRNAIAVKEADDWMYKIYLANKKTKQFDEKLLLKTWKAKLFVSSIYQYDFAKWKILKNSWCFKIAEVSFYEKLFLFIKCLVKRKVGTMKIKLFK